MSATTVPAIKAPPSWPVRATRVLLNFARRSPMSAFWGVIALLILLMAIFAPLIAPVDPLRSNFRFMQ
jgi:ABC-type dipeptide/oligopeptide/nickel transport system permease subunit